MKKGLFVQHLQRQKPHNNPGLHIENPWTDPTITSILEVQKSPLWRMDSVGMRRQQDMRLCMITGWRPRFENVSPLSEWITSYNKPEVTAYRLNHRLNALNTVDVLRP
jgi:hypothetical protein